jgi:hypothetical protein
MIRIAEKPEFTIARAVKVRSTATVVSVGMCKKPYNYAIFRKNGCGTEYS